MPLIRGETANKNGIPYRDPIFINFFTGAPIEPHNLTKALKNLKIRQIQHRCDGEGAIYLG